jgi:pyruvate dehydrogenase E2 component (dihydrolipoyllysine-residue acetyltransferase)
MPTLSEGVEEGVLVTWFVVPGASVRAGDLVAEVQVEKVSEEVRAPADGCLVEALVGQGEVVRQGAPIAVLELGAAEAVEPDATPRAVLSAVSPPEAGAPAPASPAARRLARELGVDLAGVHGRGPGGRVVEADVREAATAGASEGPAAAAEAEPLSLMRRTIATRLTAGLSEAAQLTLIAEADATDLAAELARLGALVGRRPSYTAAVVRASALALRDHPRMARRWSDEGLVPATAIDIGVAVAVDDGLVVPVLRAADGKGLDRLGEEVAELAERTRAGSITSQETQGAVMSVTSLGAHRIDALTPLLDLPQSAILGVGRVRPRPAVVDGQVVARMLMVLSLTIDHRVVDGEPAAGFLDQVIALLERPSGLA